MTVISDSLVLQSHPKRPTLFAAFTQSRIRTMRGFWHHGRNARLFRGLKMNTEIVQGDDLRLIITVRDQSGQLVDISAASDITYAIASDYSSLPLIEKKLSTGEISINSDSSFFFDLTAGDSGSLPASHYFHECEIITSGGLTYTVLQGRIRVLPQIIM